MSEKEVPQWLPQWCWNAAYEINATPLRFSSRELAELIARHAPQQPQRPKSIREIALEHGFDLTKIKEQGEVVDVMTGKNNSQQPQPASEPPERPYACDEHNGSYLDEPTQREVEVFTPQRQADHDRICREKDAEIEDLMCEIKDLQATNDDQGDALIAANQRAELAEAKVKELEKTAEYWADRYEREIEQNAKNL